MCIGSFSLHSKWIGLSKRDPNSSVLRRDVESDRLIGNSYFTSNNIPQYDHKVFFFVFLFLSNKWSLGEYKTSIINIKNEFLSQFFVRLFKKNSNLQSNCAFKAFFVTFSVCFFVFYCTKETIYFVYLNQMLLRTPKCHPRERE